MKRFQQNVTAVVCGLSILVASCPNVARTAEETNTHVKPTQTAKTDLPKVLLIGDSICNGYAPFVRQLLEGKALVETWTSGANVKSIGGRLRATLARARYDVIHFNIGLHGLGNRIAPDEYEPLFRQYVETMVVFSRGATLIWASTTPVRKRGTTELDPEENPKVVRRNAIAARVAKEYGIQVNDLYGLTVKHLELGGADGVHWKRPEGYRLMAEQIAGVVKKALAARKAQGRQRFLEPTLKKIHYGPDEKNVLNFWRADVTEDTPVVVLIHGGGWVVGAKAEHFDRERIDLWNGIPFLKAGISVVSIDYRLTPQHPLPAPVYDAARAVQFVRHKASVWGLRKDRLAVAGGSAGGATSLWLLYHDDLADPKAKDPVARESTKPTCAAVEAPQTCIDPKVVREWVGDKILQHRMIPYSVGARSAEEILKNYDKYKETFREFSAYFHVDRNDPPAFLYCFGSTEVPAASVGMAIHSPVLCLKLKQKADAVGAECDFLMRTSRKKTFYDEALRQFIISKLLRK